SPTTAITCARGSASTTSASAATSAESMNCRLASATPDSIRTSSQNWPHAAGRRRICASSASTTRCGSSRPTRRRTHDSSGRPMTSRLPRRGWNHDPAARHRQRRRLPTGAADTVDDQRERRVRSAHRRRLSVTAAAPRRGLLTQWMLGENVEFDRRIGGVSPLPASSALESYDGLIPLGGGYMPDEPDRAPWLAEEAELVRHSLDTDLPQLGICLGGQLIAQVIGGDVRARTGAPEKGYTDIRNTAEAADGPWFVALRER